MTVESEEFHVDLLCKMASRIAEICIKYPLPLWNDDSKNLRFHRTNRSGQTSIVSMFLMLNNYSWISPRMAPGMAQIRDRFNQQFSPTLLEIRPFGRIRHDPDRVTAREIEMAVLFSDEIGNNLAAEWFGLIASFRNICWELVLRTSDDVVFGELMKLIDAVSGHFICHELRNRLISYECHAIPSTMLNDVEPELVRQQAREVVLSGVHDENFRGRFGIDRERFNESVLMMACLDSAIDWHFKRKLRFSGESHAAAVRSFESTRRNEIPMPLLIRRLPESKESQVSSWTESSARSKLADCIESGQSLISVDQIDRKPALWGFLKKRDWKGTFKCDPCIEITALVIPAVSKY